MSSHWVPCWRSGFREPRTSSRKSCGSHHGNTGGFPGRDAESWEQHARQHVEPMLGPAGKVRSGQGGRASEAGGKQVVGGGATLEGSCLMKVAWRVLCC